MKRTATVVLIAHLAVFGSGCATVTSDITRAQAPEGPGGVVIVSVFERRAHLAAGRPAPFEVTSRLSRLQGKELVPVHQSNRSTWSLSGLPTGKYVFEVTGWVDAQGKVHAEATEESFRIADGESVGITAVLRDRRRNVAVTTAAVAGGAGVLGYAIYSLLSWRPLAVR